MEDTLAKLPVNATDIAVFAVLLISGLIALFRGFVLEVLSLCAWVGAALVAVYGFSHVKPWLLQHIPNDLAASAIAGGGVFLVALILFSIIATSLSSLLRDGVFKALDRSLGFLFGILRGALLVCLAYIVLAMAVSPDDYPDWFVEARTLPLIQDGAEIILGALPADTRQGLADALATARKTTGETLDRARQLELLTQPPAGGADGNSAPDAPADGTGDGAGGYDDQTRGRIETLIEGSNQ